MSKQEQQIIQPKYPEFEQDIGKLLQRLGFELGKPEDDFLSGFKRKVSNTSFNFVIENSGNLTFYLLDSGDHVSVEGNGLVCVDLTEEGRDYNTFKPLERFFYEDYGKVRGDLLSVLESCLNKYLKR